MTLILIWLVCAIGSAAIASNKGRSGLGWFFVSSILGVFGLLLVAILPKLEDKSEAALQTKCPSCFGPIDRRATTCRHCQNPVTPEITAEQHARREELRDIERSRGKQLTVKIVLACAVLFVLALAAAQRQVPAVSSQGIVAQPRTAEQEEDRKRRIDAVERQTGG